jgi:kynurenine formamidase
MRFVDLSHELREGMPVFKGFPQPRISPFFTHEESRERYQGKAEFEVTEVEFVTSISTYVDSPYHRYGDMDDIGRMPLESFVHEGIMIDLPSKGGDAPIEMRDIGGHDLKGKAVLLHTGWDRYWGDERYFSGPYLSKEAAAYLVEEKAKLVGIDTINIDSTRGPERPAHSLLLKNNIPIVENLRNLGELEGKRFRFYAVPVKVKAAAFPVRAFAEVY